MKSLQILRTSSGAFNSVQNPQKPSSPRPSSVRLHRDASFSHCNVRRSLSESDMVSLVRSQMKSTGKLGSTSFSVPRIPEEFGERAEEAAALLSGGGMNKYGSGGCNNGGNNYGSCGGDDHGFFEMGDYYQEMIEIDPTNPLLLGNYAKFLHEVERDYVKAEEYCGRAILASPGDGEVLSLYGKLIWKTQRDEDRANSYFQQALQASPNDCMVLGSYANFLWESEDDDDGQETEKTSDNAVMVDVF